MTHLILPGLVGATVALAAVLVGFSLGEVLHRRRAAGARAEVIRRELAAPRRHRLN
jgi:hypothetical protein